MSKSNDKQCCVHAYVSGRVQGVWFRAFTREHALANEVNGWAKNLPDGRVEVMLSGTGSAIEDVLAALQQGPPLAKVTGIERETLPWQSLSGFTTG